MKTTLRAIGFGLLTAVVIISVVEAIGHVIYPVASDMDYNNKELMKAFIESLPFGALAFVAMAWILGSFGGGIVATKISTEKAKRNALIVGGLVLVFTIMNMFMIPHPLWMLVTAFVGIVPAAFFGSVLSEKK